MEDTDKLVIIQSSAVQATIPSFSVKFASLGDLISEDGSNYPQVILLGEIIRCESQWKNVCNQKYGCNAGQGIAQIIPSTIKYCEEKLERKIDPFNERDNLDCAMWLLVNEGWEHWGTAITSWGSYNCFKAYIP